MANGLGLQAHEKAAVIVNGIALIVLIFLAWLSVSAGWLLLLAGSVGGLGGLVHEFAQSKGKIVFFQRHEDGVYLGSVAGIFLGAVAALLAIRGYVIDSPPGVSLTQLSYEGFLAGLALKGITEAAGGTTVLATPPPPAPLPPPAPPSRP
jgi:hypothetical protein